MINNIAYGTYKLDQCITKENVINAISIGYRTIDTADLYKNHVQVGEAINECIEKSKTMIIFKENN